jgi:hypothetical protein
MIDNKKSNFSFAEILTLMCKCNCLEMIPEECICINCGLIKCSREVAFLLEDHLYTVHDKPVVHPISIDICSCEKESINGL